MPRHDIRRSGQTTEQLSVEKLSRQWRIRSAQPPQPAWPGPAKWDAYASIIGLRAMRDYDTAFPCVAVGQSLYFASSSDDAIHCIDTRSGTTRWVHFTDAPVRVAPTVADGYVYFGSDDGHAYCIRADDGELVWQSEAVTEERDILNNARFISRTPCRTGVIVRDGTAWFGLSLLPWRQSFLCAVDAKTGRSDGPGHFVQSLSAQTLEGGLLLSDDTLIALRGRVSPALFDCRDGSTIGVFQEGGGGSFASLSRTGSLLHGPGNKTGWISESLLGTRKRKASFLSRKAVLEADDRLILLADDSVTAVRRSDSEEVWAVSEFHLESLILAGDTVFVGGQDKVIAVDVRDGRELWRSRVEGRARELVVADQALFASTDRGVIECFRADPRGPKILEDETTLETPAPVRSSPSVVSTQPRPDGLIGQWVFHSAMSQRAKRRGLPSADRRVQNMAGSGDGLISGNVLVREVGGVEALELDGRTNSVMIAEDHADAELPEGPMTAEAWVRVDRPLKWGGIIGAVQDNGSDEKGWVLGFQDSQFSFAVASQQGPGKLTYLAGRTRFEPQRWYHVVGTYDGSTQRIFVNGSLDNESTEQQGAIRYPGQAFFELGAYHDKDENFRMTGMLHEVRLYERALDAAEIGKLYEAKRQLFAVPIRLASGPYATFTDPRTAVIRWETYQPSPTDLQLTGHGPTRRIVEEHLRKSHEVTLTDLTPNQVGHYMVRTATDGRVGISPDFELDTGFNFTSPQFLSKSPSDQPEQSVRLAREVLDRSGMDRGLCLVLGIHDTSVAMELVRSSRFHVVCVDTDRQRVEQARKMLFEAGLYGKRICARHVDSFAELPFVSCCANLVISERQLFEGDLVVDSRELDRVLRPFGGVAWFDWSGSRKKKSTASLENWTGQMSSNYRFSGPDSHPGLKITRPALPESGEWSHLYGRADNSAFGGESLGGASTVGELGVQWIGRPGPRAQPDRNGRKPSPLSINGRLFVQGLHRLIGLDAMNGVPLWSLEIPSLERFNMPRDCGNWCADSRFVYVAIRGECWQVDANSGEIVEQHKVVPVDRDDWNFDWGYVARVEELLLGSAVKQGTAYTNFWGKADAGWYDARTGSTTFKVCSDNLFALNPTSGDKVWIYRNGLIINSTISADGSSIEFVECRHPEVSRSSARRVGTTELWQQQFLVSLDLRTGRVNWERPLDTEDGTVVFNMAKSGDHLVLSSSNSQKYDVYGFSTPDGKSLWHQTFGWPDGKGDHGKAMSRPAIVGNMVLVRPRALELTTGSILPVSMPGGGCGTYAATTGAVFFRSGNVTAWDPLTGSSTSWNRLRPGCWLSTIPANGMLLSPEAGGGCSCGSWLETSVGFLPTSQ